MAGGLIKIQALVAAIETLPAQPGSPFKAAVPSRQKAPASAESVLETYQRLLTEKPREAGQFYAENAEEILAGLAAREREERAALQATYPWNKR